MHPFKILLYQDTQYLIISRFYPTDRISKKLMIFIIAVIETQVNKS